MLFEPPKFRIRASSIGAIMSGGRGKSKAEKIAELETTIKSKEEMQKNATEGKAKDNRQEAIAKLQIELSELVNTKEELPEGVKTYCENWLKSQVEMYDRRKTFTSKQTDKGNRVEGDSIDYLDFVFKWTESGEYVQKNELWKQNDFMNGTADLVLPIRRKIIDTKNSTDCFTFPLFETELPDTDYWWQGQGYMELWNMEEFEVIYVLMDMPEDMIQKEAKFKLPQFYTQADYEEFRKDYIYSNLEDWKRIKSFPFKRDREAIERVKIRVEQCQKYINSLVKNIKIQ
jgi:hypothetical protein